MKHLKLERAKAIEAYKNGDVDTKKLLIDLYGKETFLTDVKDGLIDYGTACVILGRTPKLLSAFEALYDTKPQAKKMYARHKVQTGIEALNEGWLPDYKNTNQAKYEVWMQHGSNGFSSLVSYRYYCTLVGSDFVLETREKGELIAKIFHQDLIDYLT